ncbi:sensory neuron membrane protein 2 [Sitodiplosis mosellana]|uniref:sensory neuron membrane protein 2 n=1 Tax=Sitodiplosis mosellana TaxID=263140 RepID=UPI00244441CE|nr:sensory neuron membrane protein 2 [Sitodiplosis mosellana]
MFNLKWKGVSKLGLGAICGIVSAILGAFFGWVLFPALVAIEIDKQTVLEEGTEQFERFVNIPQPLHFKVFIFNVTNPNEVIEGGVPKVKEIGPYIYRQYRNKDISSVSPDKRFVIFRGIQKFIFDEHASAPLTESDNLVVLNVQLNSVVQMAESSMPAQLGILNGQLEDVFGEKYDSMFMTVKVSDLLFDGVPLCVNPSGIASFICSVIKNQKPRAIKEIDDGSMRFSLFGHKNNTDDGLFEIHSGVGDIEKLGAIRKWNNRHAIKAWMNATDGGKSTCNFINGTDSTVYAPHIKPNAYLDIFATDICRSVKIYYAGKIRYAGIPGYHFESGSDFLESIGPEFGNECFCIDRIVNVPVRSNGCLYKGALDLSTCQGGPIIMTFPHMLGSAAEYRTVKGLHPDPKRHLTFADIEPNTGYPLRGAKRVQLNMFIKKINQIDVTEQLQTCLLPIVWVEEGVELNDAMQSLLKWKLIYILIALDLLYYSMIFGGFLTFAGCSIWYLVRRNQENKVIPLT